MVMELIGYIILAKLLVVILLGAFLYVVDAIQCKSLDPPVSVLLLVAFVIMGTLLLAITQLL